MTDEESYAIVEPWKNRMLARCRQEPKKIFVGVL